MKTSTRFLTSLCLGAASAQVHIPLSRYDGNLDRIARRDNTQFGLHSADYLYVANISVGTPGQPMQVVISQASDTWVPDASISYCDPEYYSYYKDDPQYAYLYNQYKDYCKWGTFNKTVSSTYAAANVKYRTFYTYDVTGSYVSGDNFTDNLSIGGITLENYSIGLVDSANNYIGILGLGQNRSYTSSSSSSSSGKYTYTHFLDKLVEQDKIKSAAYSIWLDDAEGKSGNLLLGAIDTSKFDGTLTRLSAYQSSYYIPSYSFGVELSAINGTDKSSASKQPLTGNDFPLPMAIDTATAMSYFPTSLAGKLWSMAGATYNRTLGYATIPCNADGSAEFDFQLAGSSGPILNVQLKDLIFSRSVLPYSYQSYLNNTETCIFGIQNISSSSSYSYSNIGSGLLRRTYLVVDTENLEIAVAPVKFGSTASSNVVSFAARAAVAPSATMYCGSTSSYYCKSTCTANCNPTSTARSSSSPTSGSGGGSSSGTSISSLYGWQQAAIGVGITFGIIILLALGAAAVIWRRAIRKDNAPAAKMLEDETVEYLPPPPGMTGPAGAPADRGLNPIGEEPQMTSAPQLPPLPPRGGDLNADIHPPREPSPLSDTGHEAVAAEQQPPAGESKEPEVIPEQPTERPPAPPSPVVEGKGKAPETQAS